MEAIYLPIWAYWIQIGSTILLATAAFLAPYLVEKWKSNYRIPVLKINFKLEPPDCHDTLFRLDTKINNKEIIFQVYYFRFIVKNVGMSHADSCQVFLERIFKENSAGEMIENKNFTPINLKWSGVSKTIEKDIYPDKETYCDLGRIHHPAYKYLSAYKNISKEEQELNKFIFELAENPLYSQWDCLIPGRYNLVVSVYSKNSKKVTKKFSLSWTGIWKDDVTDMFNELVIH